MAVAIDRPARITPGGRAFMKRWPDGRDIADAKG
jgi:hypothetical protein